MKLHLPRFLAAALLAAVVSGPAFSGTLPENYNPVHLRAPESLTVTNNTIATGFYLYDNANYTYFRNDPDAKNPFYGKPYSLYFTSAKDQSSVRMAFMGGYTKAFSQVEHLSFVDMTYLEFSSMQAGAISASGYSAKQYSTLTFSRIDDGIPTTDAWDLDFYNNGTEGNCGGAIDTDFTHIYITDNGGVRFSGNNALTEPPSSENQNQGSSGGVSVGVGHSYTISLFGYKFSFGFGASFGLSYEYDNPQTPDVIEGMDMCGGAINLVSSTLTMTGNENVTFTSNTASDHGGAISCGTLVDEHGARFSSSVAINNNDSVYFAKNMTVSNVYTTSSNNGTITGGGGGAIFIDKDGHLEMNNNTGNVVFTENLAAAAGGAIYYGGTDSSDKKAGIQFLNNQGKISFTNNVAGAHGGAIYTTHGGILDMTGNKSVSFENNKAGVCGGAISSINGTVTINDNSAVVFRDNLVFHQDYSGSIPFIKDTYVGGAIYGSGLQIHNNGSVLFERNAERTADGLFRLRSLYLQSRDERLLIQPDYYAVSLSAGTNQSIEFRDSIYIDNSYEPWYMQGHSVYSKLYLNSSYRPTDATEDIRQDGDIIFTGVSTEEDLIAVKKAWLGEYAYITVHQSEIEASRTSSVLGQTYLNGGRLRVEKGAVFQSAGLYLTEGSQSTLRLDDGKLVNIDVKGAVSNQTAISVASGTTLEVLGRSTIEGGKLNFADGATWSFALTGNNTAGNAALTLVNSALLVNGKLTIKLDVNDTSMNSNYYLYSGSEASEKDIMEYWNTDYITVVGTGDATGATIDDLMWHYGRLIYVSTLRWTNASNSGIWDFDDKNWQNDRSFSSGMNVKFSDEGAGTVKMSGKLTPGSVTVSNSEGNDYTFTSAEDGGYLSEYSDLTKRGDGALTLDSANDYYGTTTVEEGTLNVHDSQALGDSTLKTAKDTELNMGDNSHVVLKDKDHDISGNVFVEAGSSLEMSSGYYSAESTTLEGTLSFIGLGSQAGTLEGNGKLNVTDSFIRFEDASNFTGSATVSGGSLFLGILNGVVKAGEIAVKAGELTLNASQQLTMGTGTILSMVAGTVAEKVATVITDKLVELGSNAILSIMLNSALGDMDESVLNDDAYAVITAPGLTLNAGSTLILGNSHIELNGDNNCLTLNVPTNSPEKIHLTLLLDEILDANSIVMLFSGVDALNLVFDDTVIGKGAALYECYASDYFSCDLVGEATKLVYVDGVVYLTGLNVVPEPATATLSLLALTALASRRRRR